MADTTGWVDTQLYGGPLDGEITITDPSDPDPGIAMIVPTSDQRAWYEPDETGRWTFVGTSH
jgi:hypothetical protein